MVVEVVIKRFSSIEAEISDLRKELDSLKSKIMVRSMSPNSMTPFATRLPPVQPANSVGGTLGTKSLQ